MRSTPTTGIGWVYVLSGPDYATKTMIGDIDLVGWTSYSYDITKWRGQSIKLRVEVVRGWVAVDNVGVIHVTVPHWQGPTNAELAAGGPWGNYMKVFSLGPYITSTAFTVPAQATVGQIDILGSASNVASRVFVLSGPGYTTVTEVLGYKSPTVWTRYSFDVAQ